MSKVVRSVKNVTKGYSQVQVKVRNATSNDAWGPTGTEMSEIAQMTFSGSNDFYEIMDMLDKRMNDKGKNWRHVLKSLKVLDYCLHEGSEMVVTWTRKNIYIIRTLREFQHVDDDGRDVGLNSLFVHSIWTYTNEIVRSSAKELTSLLQDEERLRAERADRKTWKSRVTGIEEYAPHGSNDLPAPRRQPERERRNRDGNTDDNDLEYRLALEASVNEAEEDAKRRQSRDVGGVDDDDLAKAIKLSKEEEELRRRELEESNANNLFDLDAPVTNSQQPQYTGWNQGYQQQGAVDWFGNPVGQPQQSQNTGFLNNAYNQDFQSQPTGFHSQQTGMANGYGQQNFDPNQFQQQQQQNFLQPQQTIQPQQTAFNTLNPYTQQQDLFGQQQQQPTSPVTAGTNNPWATTNNQTEPIKPMPTGSNNPFASQFSKQQATQQQNRRPQQPTLETLAEQRTAVQFNNQNQQQQSTYNPITNFSAPQQIPQQTAKPARQEMDPTRARLNALLASGEGMDTFGNTGEMRIPAQHTAPGTFVNSAGQNLNRLHATQTGNNPFFSQQFTGMPQQQFPAQTGPAGQFGQATNNPFGQRQQPPSNSLIDL